MAFWRMYRKSCCLTILVYVIHMSSVCCDYDFPNPSSAPNVQLYQTLLNNYVRTRPVMDITTTTVVSARLRLLQLLSLDGNIPT